MVVGHGRRGKENGVLMAQIWAWDGETHHFFHYVCTPCMIRLEFWHMKKVEKIVFLVEGKTVKVVESLKYFTFQVLLENFF